MERTASELTTDNDSRLGEARALHVVEGSDRRSLRFMFVSLGHLESDFYGRVGAELARRGHEVAHITYSRRAARVLEREGFTAYCLPDRMAALGPVDAAAQAARIEAEYDVPTFRDIYRTDAVCDGRSERWCVERAVRHILATERMFDDWQPDVTIPEVGNETIRAAAHLVSVRRQTPVLFLGYTIFDDPLRLCVDDLKAPIVSAEDIREITPTERAEVEAFIADYRRRDAPIRAYRSVPITMRRARIIARHFAVRLLYDRDNDYLRPMQWLLNNARELVLARLVRPLYRRARPHRPYVYFPLHLSDDYKLKRVTPHCADQHNLVAQIARALPYGYDLIVKEHPLSIGRNSPGYLRRLHSEPNVRLLEPRTSSLALIEGAEAVVVVSSTVGLEALLLGKPVLTLGNPFYAGFGVTTDVRDFSELTAEVPALLRRTPDRERTIRFLHAAMRNCVPGAPVLVDRSDENVVALAGSLEHAADAEIIARLPHSA